MKATIKSIHLENFKGVKDKTFDFGGYPRVVEGRNASGKTTIATAYMWLFTDKDLDLNSNPDVKPLGVEECTPTVSVIMDIDGKEVEFSKVQKNKKSKPDENGNYKVSTTNSYLVNSVPMTERDFKAKLTELEFPTDNDFLLMSHTNVFTNMKQADQRKILFGMVDGITDLDVAAKVDGIEDLKALMQNYSLDEIEAMQKASKKKAEDQLKNIPGQIEGLELAKTDDVDTSEQELLVKTLQEQIATERTKAEEIRKEKSEYATLCQKGLELEFDRNSELTRMNNLANEGRKDLEDKVNRSANALIDAKRRVAVINAEINQNEQVLENAKKNFENLKEEFTNAKALVFDDSKAVCPCCGQTYPEDKKAEIIKAFETDKKSRMDSANLKAKTVQGDIKNYEKTLAESQEELKQANSELQNLEKVAADLNKQLEDFKPSEVKPTDELKAIEQKIEANNKAKAEIESHNNDEKLIEINTVISKLQAQIDEANKVIGANSNNIRIDEQIETLSNKRLELEQAKADCEKILFQLSEFSKARNNLLTDEINKHFKKVKFQLFKFQKNGEYKEDCQILSLDGKPLGVSCNSALELIMKIDICQAFQRYYGKQLALFVDEAEKFSEDSYNDLECETQHIYLKVTDSDLEVK